MAPRLIRRRLVFHNYSPLDIVNFFSQLDMRHTFCCHADTRAVTRYCLRLLIAGAAPCLRHYWASRRLRYAYRLPRHYLL